MNKKIITYAAIAVVVVAIVTTVIIFMSKNNNTTETKAIVTTKTVNDTRAKAEAARASHDATQAKTLLEEAQKQNNELPKTDETTNTSVDIEAQLFMLEHANATTN